MSIIGGFFDVLLHNRVDLEDVIQKLGGLDATVRFAAGAGPDLIRIMQTFAKHQDPVAAVSVAQSVLAYNQETEDRVKAFQATHGLVMDGIVGDKTWSKVEELIQPTKGTVI
jgi:murein L,D-transpeptidase YcbB/YkuD